MGDTVAVKDALAVYHPYSRYGLAIILYRERKRLEEIDYDSLPELLARGIESGLGRFRMTPNLDITSQKVRYTPIKMEELERQPSLVTGGAKDGRYLFPTVITSDKSAGNTFKKAAQLIDDLRQIPSKKKAKSNVLEKPIVLERSFAPVTAKINYWSRPSIVEPKGTLAEAACSAITSLTHIKPAAYVKAIAKEPKVEFYNTTIIPDLDLTDLISFIELFDRMLNSEMTEKFMEADLSKRSPGEDETDQEKSKFKRPRIHNGNYPFAPSKMIFDAVGLLAAIGRWAHRANETAWAKRILETIAGTKEKPGRPLYIVSYNEISQAQFTHHVVGLSLNGKLSEIIEKLIWETQLYSAIEGGRLNRDAPSYKLFYLMASRFLQQFTTPSFRDFLATRVEYAQEVQPLFEEYFMQKKQIPKEIVESARALGQWLNRTAYFVAEREVEAGAPDRQAKVRKEKAKILIEFESAAMSAKTAQDMLHRISTRAGRLLQQDAPVEATRFMDATNSGEIEPEDAQHLLVAYLRLRAGKSAGPDGSSGRTSSEDGYGLDGSG